MLYGPEDDQAIALQAAVTLYGGGGKFALAACAVNTEFATGMVLETAEAFIAWLRKPASIKLVLVSIEDPLTGETIATTPGGTVTTIKDSGPGSRARYVIDAADGRGFAVDAALAVRTAPEGFATAVIEEATSGTASGKDELVVDGLAPGSTLVTVFDPAQPDVVFGSDAVDVTVSGVATITLGTPTIEDAPAAPVEDPAPVEEPTSPDA